MTVSEVARYLSLDPQTVSRKAQSGHLPAFKVGNRWRFDREDIDGWILEQKRGGIDISARIARVWERMRQKVEKSGLAVASVPEIVSSVRAEARSEW